MLYRSEGSNFANKQASHENQMTETNYHEGKTGATETLQLLLDESQTIATRLESDLKIL